MVDFDTLPPDKQNAILNAAFMCFGKNGYKKASIADIAQEAGISKASIFQYFGSKKALYAYIFNYACDMVIGELPAGSDDFFECLRMGSDAKMRVMARHPGIYHFLAQLVIEADDAVAEDVKSLMKKQIDGALWGFLRDVNWDKLKPGISPEMLINAVRWVNDGYLKESVEKKDYETMRRELFEYLDVVKKAYYKEEYL